MPGELISDLFLLIKRRMVALVLIMLVGGLLVTLHIRNKPVPYTISVPINAIDNSNGQSSDLGSMGMLLGNSGMRQQYDLIRNQERILRSHEMYDAINKELPGFIPKYQRTGLSYIALQIKVFIFGRDYVETEDKYRDLEYLVYRDMVYWSWDQESSLFHVGFVSGDAEQALQVTRLMAKFLIGFQREKELEQYQHLKETMASQLASIKQEIDVTSDELAKFMREENYAPYDSVIEQQYLEYLAQKKELDAAVSRLAQLEAAMKQAKVFNSSIAKLNRQRITEDKMPRIDAIVEEIALYESELAKRVGEDSKATSFIRNQLSSLRAELNNSMDGNKTLMTNESLQEILTVSEKRIVELSEQINSGEKALQFSKKRFVELESMVKKIPTLKNRISKVQVGHEENMALLANLTKAYSQALLNHEMKVPPLRIAGEPMMMVTMQSNKFRLWIASLAGLFLAVLGAFVVFDHLRESIVRVQKTESLGVRALGIIPELKSNLKFSSIWESDESRSLGYQLAEGFQANRDANVVLVTGAQARSGKTATALYLASGLLRQGLSVLLIDSNVEQNEHSISHYLSRMRGFDHIPNLKEFSEGFADEQIASFQAVKLTGQNSQQDMSSSEFSAMLSVFNNKFDCVVIDGLPLSVPETIMSVRNATEIVYCCPEGRETSKSLRDSIEQVRAFAKKDAAIFTVLSRCKSSFVPVKVFEKAG